MTDATEARDVQFGEHTEAARRAQRQQQESASAAEHRRRLRAMVVPTDDREVRVWLRKLGHPITLFGERAMERRERLRGLMTTLSDKQRDALTERLMQLDVENRVAPSEKFYTEGPPALRDLRRKVAQFAAQRASERLAAERARRQDADSASDEARMVLQEAARTANVSSQIGGKRPLQGVAISPDSSLVATADWGGLVSLWTLDENLTRVKILQAHEERCTDVAWHPRALTSDAAAVPPQQGEEATSGALAFATASADSTAKLWDMNGTCLATCTGHTRRLARLAYHPSGDAMATCSFDGTWRLWDTGTATCLAEQEGHSRAVYSIAFHPDGSLCGSGGLDAATRVWDCRTGRNVLTFKGYAYGVLSLAFSPNGYHVATGSLDNTVRVWDLRKRGALYCITGHLKLVSHVRFDPIGGHYLLSTSYDKTCKVWNAQTWQLATCLAGHSGVVMGGDIAGDGTGTIVTTSFDRGIKLWRPLSGEDGDGDAAMDI